ncbi:MAG: hypothetical protein ACLFQ6_13165, partial [Candidatus Sumerlaeia bacterium]
CFAGKMPAVLFFDHETHETHEKPETAELFMVQPLFHTRKKASASRRTPNFVPNHFCGWNMPCAKAKTGISMKDQGIFSSHEYLLEPLQTR